MVDDLISFSSLSSSSFLGIACDTFFHLDDERLLLRFWPTISDDKLIPDLDHERVHDLRTPCVFVSRSWRLIP